MHRSAFLIKCISCMTHVVIVSSALNSSAQKISYVNMRQMPCETQNWNCEAPNGLLLNKNVFEIKKQCHCNILVMIFFTLSSFWLWFTHIWKSSFHLMENFKWMLTNVLSKCFVLQLYSFSAFKLFELIFWNFVFIIYSLNVKRLANKSWYRTKLFIAVVWSCWKVI